MGSSAVAPRHLLAPPTSASALYASGHAGRTFWLGASQLQPRRSRPRWDPFTIATVSEQLPIVHCYPRSMRTSQRAGDEGVCSTCSQSSTHRAVPPAQHDPRHGRVIAAEPRMQQTGQRRAAEWTTQPAQSHSDSSPQPRNTVEQRRTERCLRREAVDERCSCIRTANSVYVERIPEPHLACRNVISLS